MQTFTDYTGVQYVVESDVFGTGDSPTEFIPIPENFTEPTLLKDYVVECPFCGEECQHELFVNGMMCESVVCHSCKNEFDIELLGSRHHLNKVIDIFNELDDETLMDYIEGHYQVTVNTGAL